MEITQFIRAVRTGDWRLDLTSLQLFTKYFQYFFAHDRLKYARMIPLNFAEMKCCQCPDPEIYEQFCEGNWVGNKNLHVPAFCALGADHALEQKHRSLNVSGGLVQVLYPESKRPRQIFSHCS